MPRGIAARGNLADTAAATEERPASCGFWALGGICNVAGARPKPQHFPVLPRGQESMVKEVESDGGRLSGSLGSGIAQLRLLPEVNKQAAGSKQQAASSKQQAAKQQSSKQQSSKQQSSKAASSKAASSKAAKQQAANSKQQASSCSQQHKHWHRLHRGP